VRQQDAHPAYAGKLGAVTTRDVKASRPNWPRGQNFGLGLGLVTSGLGLGSRDPLVSASSFWPRPRTLIFNFKEPGVLSFRNTSEPPLKKDAQHCLVTVVQHHRIRTPLTNHRINSPDISSSSTLTVLTQQLNPLHSPNSILTSHYCNLYFSVCSVCQPVLLQ